MLPDVSLNSFFLLGEFKFKDYDPSQEGEFEFKDYDPSQEAVLTKV